MKNSYDFLKAIEDQKCGWMWKGKPFKMPGGIKVQINEKKYDIAPGIQKSLDNSSEDTMKSMSDVDEIVFRDM